MPRRAAQLALILIASVAYALVYRPLRIQVGMAAGLVAMVPVVLSGWFFGLRGGVIAGLTVPLLNTLLLNLGGHPGWDIVFRETDGLGPIASIAVGAVVGHWSDLARALQRQIGEHRRAQAALQESQQLFESAFRHAAIGKALVAPNGHFLKVNQALCQLVGYSEAELLATDFQAITHPDDLEADLEHVRQMLAGTIQTYQMEKRYFHKQGHAIWILLSVSLVRDSQGQPLYFISQIQDITERKQAELVFRGLLESAPDAMIIANPHGEIVLINSQAERLFGYSRQEVLGQAVERLMPERFREVHIQHRAAFMRETRARPMGANLELFAVHQDGHEFPVEVSLSHLTTATGQLISSTVRDITERKRAEQALAASEQRYRTLAYNFPNGAVMLFDHDLRYLLADGAGLGEVGLAKEMLEGKTIWEIFSPEVAAQLEPPYQAALAGTAGVFEVPFAGRLYLVHVLPLRDEHGAIAAGMAMTQDITARKQAEAQVADLLVFNETVLKSAPVGILTYKHSGECVLANENAATIVGASVEGLRAQNFRSIEAWQRSGLYDLVETALERGRAGTADVHHFSTFGKEVWLTAQAVPFQSKGEAHVLLVIADITERKQTEQALRESEARYRDLFEESSTPLSEQDFSAVKQRLDGLRRQGVTDFRSYLDQHPEIVAECAALVRIIDVNRATVQLYGGQNKAELLHNLDHLFSEETYAEFRDELVSIADGKTGFEWEGVNRTLAGDRLVVHVRWSVVRGYEDSLSKVIISLTDITERRQAEERLQRAASHDALTGLPNRGLFLDRLRLALERERRHQEFAFAVLFLDFDRFKVINDSLGHLLGDQLLIAGARRLADCVRALDTVARLGGDEFVILLEDVQGFDAVMHVADRIQRALQQPFDLDGHNVVTSASIGIVLSPAASEQPEDILRDADAAMYRAKALGKARHEVFDAEMRTEAVARLKLETDLRRALECEEFRVHYQPIVSLATRQTTGFEALVRWQHPELGLLPPAAFMATAEETGLIVPLGHWLLRRACRQLGAWQTLFPRKPPLTLSVNLSSKQIAQPELDRLIEALLTEYRLAPRSLRLEITERTIIDDTLATTGVLARLKALGVQLEIDDFGTGYSALSYLQRLEMDGLKIDRSFIQQLGMEDNRGAVIRTILALGHSLDLQIVAEGVETEAQLDKLKALGCHVAQGYLFGKPMEAGEAEALLAA